jgi:outer membrane protein
MNKVQIALNVVLVAAVATLFGLVLSKKKAPVVEATVPTETLPVAYLNVDSLLANYIFAQEANETLMKKQEDARLKMNTKLRTFQNEVTDFQRKLENNVYLTRERAEKEQQRLAKKEQELQALEAKLTEDILLENQNLNKQLVDSLNSFLKEFNADGRYHVILSNNANDNVLMAAEQYDITSEVIEGMNKRYAKK